jgi:hypothetical protein
MNDVQANITEKTATVAAQGAHVAPPSTPARKGSTSKKNAPKAPAAAKGRKAKAAAPKKEAKPPKTTAKKVSKSNIATAPGQMRPESKGAKVLELIRRAKGATLAEIMKATGWQAHSVRGFISGTLGKKMGLSVASTKPEGGDRVYSISK